MFLNCLGRIEVNDREGIKFIASEVAGDEFKEETERNGVSSNCLPECTIKEITG